jgi:hypothetical protein
MRPLFSGGAVPVHRDHGLAWPQLRLAWSGVAPQNPAHYDVPLRVRINYGVAYLGLIAFLGAMTYSVHQDLEVVYHRCDACIHSPLPRAGEGP